MWLFGVVLFASVYFADCHGDVCFESDNDTIIHMNLLKNKDVLKCDNSTAPQLVYGDLFSVCGYYEKNVTRIRCYRLENYRTAGKIIFEKFYHFFDGYEGRTYYTTDQDFITPAGKWNFECIFYTEDCNSSNQTHCLYESNDTSYEDEGEKCAVEFEVKDVTPSGYLSVKGKNYTLPNVDKNIYYFSDGETVNFRCYILIDTYDCVLFHTNGLSTGQHSCTDTLKLSMKLTAVDNDTLITCSLANTITDSFDSATIRLILNPNDTKESVTRTVPEISEVTEHVTQDYTYQTPVEYDEDDLPGVIVIPDDDYDDPLESEEVPDEEYGYEDSDAIGAEPKIFSDDESGSLHSTSSNNIKCGEPKMETTLEKAELLEETGDQDFGTELAQEPFRYSAIGVLAAATLMISGVL